MRRQHYHNPLSLLSLRRSMFGIDQAVRFDQEPVDDEGAGGDPPAGGGTPPSQDPPKAPKTYDEDYVKGLRDEAAKARVKNRELQDQLDGAEKGVVEKVLTALGVAPDASKTPEQLLAEAQTTASTLLTNANNRLVTAEVKATGVDMGLLDAEVAATLLDRSTVTVDEDGVVSGVKEALEALKESKPYLFGAVGSKPPVGGGTPPGNHNGPKGLDQMIAEAEAAGNIALAIALKGKKAGQSMTPST